MYIMFLRNSRPTPYAMFDGIHLQNYGLLKLPHQDDVYFAPFNMCILHLSSCYWQSVINAFFSRKHNFTFMLVPLSPICCHHLSCDINVLVYNITPDGSTVVVFIKAECSNDQDCLIPVLRALSSMVAWQF